jgi:hypothetical protein
MRSHSEGARDVDACPDSTVPSAAFDRLVIGDEHPELSAESLVSHAALST